MLTTPTSGWDDDFAMLGRWGLKGMGSFESPQVKAKESPAAMEQLDARRAQAAVDATPL